MTYKTNKQGFTRQSKSFTEKFAGILVLLIVIGLVCYCAFRLWLKADEAIYQYNTTVIDVEREGFKQ